MKIMVIKDIEREDIEFVCKGIGCRPVASLDHFLPETLGSADLVEEVQTGDSKVVKVSHYTYSCWLAVWHATKTLLMLMLGE